MRAISALILGLATQALSIPNIPLVSTLETTSTTCKNYTDTFDDLKSNPLIQLNRVGVYNDLTWEAWIYFVSASTPCCNDNNVQHLAGKGLIDTVNGIIPAFGNQISATGPSSDLLQLGVLTLAPFGNIVASPAKSFDLYSLYFVSEVKG
ncbi:hypothetical protein F5Y19DRAFT_471513 [Xylariaceae sp. FL1651]|nr:hypothetical protein F5Y19DRAFT_471513 [Xylariaceae sp. FL1651]